jgi:hypothetical protein
MADKKAADTSVALQVDGSAMAQAMMPEVLPPAVPVDTSVRPDETVAGGRYYNAAGRLINAEGKRIHPDGTVLTPDELAVE